MKKINCLFASLLFLFPFALSAAISVSPSGPYNASAGYGQATSFQLTLENESLTDTVELAAVFEGQGANTLADELARLNAAADEVLATLADRFLFRDGITGNSISDGGGDMYDGGNYLRFGAADSTPLTYSDNTVIAYADDSVSYFTRKYDGLFVLAADYKQHTAFYLQGDLGADGRGSVALSEFSAGYGYHAYVKTVHDAGDPSVNHLILVPESSILSRTAPATTHSDDHSIEGLEQDGRMYYLLFAKENGRTFGPAEIQNLASTFLQSVQGGPSWFSFPERQVLAPGASKTLPVTLDGRALDPGDYTARFKVTVAGTSSEAIPAGEFESVTFTVSSPSFGFSSVSLQKSGLLGVDVNSEVIDLLPATGSELLGSLSIASNAPWLTATRVAGQNSLQLSYQTAGLALGVHYAEITVTEGSSTRILPVNLEVQELNIVQFLPDPTRPKIYAINQNGTGQGALLVIDSASRQIERSVPLGTEPTDMDLTENASEILVIHSTEPSIHKIDLTSYLVSAIYPLETYSTNSSYAKAHVADGPGDVIYYTDEEYGPRMHVYNTASGEVLQSLGANDASVHHGFGDMDVSPDGTTLLSMLRNRYISSTTAAVRWTIQPDGTLADFIQGDAVNENYFAGNGHVTPVLSSVDGSRLVLMGRAINPLDLNDYLASYADWIFSMSSDGSVVAGERGIYAGEGGHQLLAFSSPIGIQTITRDDASLLSFDPDNRTLNWLDLNNSLRLSTANLTPVIGNGQGVIGVDQTLSWEGDPKAIHYEVYFGTDRNAVLNAGPGSSQHLGRSTDTTWTDSLPVLSLGTQYFWRVDKVGFNQEQKGAAWSFTVEPIMVDPVENTVHAPVSSPIPDQTHTMTASTALSWSAASSTPWISVRTRSGSTDSELTYVINSSGLPVGTHNGVVQITSGGSTFDLPVTLVLHRLNVVHLEAAEDAGTFYALSQTPEVEGPSFFLDLEASTGAIRRYLEVGMNASDFSIAENQNRAYFANNGHEHSAVVDLASWSHLPQLSLGTHIAYLEATPDGLLILDAASYPYNTILYDPADGSELISQSISSSYPAHSALSRSGDVYYRWISYNTLQAFRFNDGSFELIASKSGISGANRLLHGPDDMIVTGDYLLTSDLQRTLSYPSMAYAVDPTGTFTAGRTSVYWSRSGSELTTFSSYSNQQAVSSGGDYLLRYLDGSRVFESVRVDSFVILPGVFPQPGEVLATPPTRISIPAVAGATSYRLLLGTTETSGREVASQSGPEFVLPEALEPQSYYYWRIDAVTPSGQVRGDLHGFITSPAGIGLDVPDRDIAYLSWQDRKILAGYTYSYGENKVHALSLDRSTGDTVLLNSYTSSQENPAFFGANGVLAGGNFYSIRSVGIVKSDYLETGGATATDNVGQPFPDASLNYHSLKSSGDLLFLAADNDDPDNYVRKVFIYRTVPELVIEQEISIPLTGANMSADHLIAAKGDILAVATPLAGGGSTVWIYHRQSGTGVWRMTDSMTYGSHGLLRIATDGDALAVLVDPSGSEIEVKLYRQSAPGLFQFDDEFDISDFEGASYYFGRNMALDQGLLVIGDARNTQAVRGRYGAVYSCSKRDGTWRVHPPVTAEGSYYMGASLDLADGWLAVSRSGSVNNDEYPVHLFALNPEANQRPLIQSDCPYQVVAGRELEIPVTVLDDDAVSVHLDQAPGWLNVSGSGKNFVLSGTLPDTGGGMDTIRLRVTDSHGVSNYQTYDIHRLASDDLPVVETLPVDLVAPSGSFAELRPVITGSGPYTWQWFKDGVAIAGATRNRLGFDFIDADDKGTYHFEVSNVVGTTQSGSIDLAVTAASRFAGDWPTYGGSPRHLGHHPATLGSHQFMPSWSVDLEESSGLNRVAIADGKVFVTPYVYFGGETHARALQLADGQEIWTAPFENAYSVNPPTYHNGRVYIQRGNHSSDTQLWALDANTGDVIWSAAHRAQWERYEAPTVTDQGVWINGGSYGGLYGFDLDGNELFFEDMPQVGGWTPTLSEGRLFTWVRNTLKEHNPLTGKELWSFTSASNNRSNITAIVGDSMIGRGDTELYCVDMQTRSLRWQVDGAFTAHAAVFGDYVYVQSGTEIQTYRLDNGEAGVSFPCPPTMASVQPLLVNDHLIIASQSETFVYQLDTAEEVQRLPVGGYLSYADGYLLVASNDGHLHAFYANDVPDIIQQSLPDATEDIFYTQTLSAIHEDDTETLTYTLLEGPEWLDLTPEGVLSGTLGHTQGGLQTVRVQLSDGVTHPVVREYSFNGIEVNDRPTALPVDRVVLEDADEFYIPLGDYFDDEETLDADLAYQVLSHDNPTLLEVRVTADNQLAVLCLQDQYGTAILNLRGRDAGGLTVDSQVSIEVQPVNDRPVFTSEMPDVHTDDAGSSRGLDVASYVFDADPDDVLRYEIISNSHPAIFSHLSVGSLDGQLQMRFAPYVSGASELTIRVSDPDEIYSEQTIRVTLPELPLPAAVAGELRMNRQTGMYEQTLSLTNQAGRDIGGFVLRVNGLVNGYQLYGMADDTIHFLQAMAPGATQTFTLEYYSTRSGLMPTPEFELELAHPQADEFAGALGAEIDRVRVLSGQAILLEFPSVPGNSYQIQYSNDMEVWHTSPVVVTAVANRTQWLDQGLPRTNCHPSQCTSRIYRVVELQDAE